MSGETVYEFIKTFLTFSQRQRKSFLLAITAKQCDIIRSVCYNLLLNKSIELSDSHRLYLKKRINIIKKLASKRICVGDKKKILARYSGVITYVFRVILSYIILEKEKEKEKTQQKP